jgi:hypothetical protein
VGPSRSARLCVCRVILLARARRSHQHKLRCDRWQCVLDWSPQLTLIATHAAFARKVVPPYAVDAAFVFHVSDPSIPRRRSRSHLGRIMRVVEPTTEYAACAGRTAGARGARGRAADPDRVACDEDTSPGLRRRRGETRAAAAVARHVLRALLVGRVHRARGRGRASDMCFSFSRCLAVGRRQCVINAGRPGAMPVLQVVVAGRSLRAFTALGATKYFSQLAPFW